MTTAEFIQFLLERFLIEWKRRDRSGVYGFTQRLMAYNSNKIEGSTLTEEQTALKGIEALEDYFREIQMPVNLRELGCEPTDQQIAELADHCCDGDTHTGGHFLPLHSKDVAAILTAAK